MVNLCFDSSFFFVLIFYVSLILNSAPFFLSPSPCPTFQSLTSNILSDLALSFLPLSAGLSSVCVLVCVCCVGLCWWSLKPWESTHMAVCLPSSPLSPKHCCRAAFKSTGNTMKGRVHSFSLSLTVTVCLHSASVSAFAFCFCWQLRLVLEQPNKSVIHCRAVCAAAAAKQSTAPGFMEGISTLE